MLLQIKKGKNGIKFMKKRGSLFVILHLFQQYSVNGRCICTISYSSPQQTADLSRYLLHRPLSSLFLLFSPCNHFLPYYFYGNFSSNHIYLAMFWIYSFPFIYFLSVVSHNLYTLIAQVFYKEFKFY